MRLVTTLPTLALELTTLLVEAADPHLAPQIQGLGIVERCPCGDAFCSTFYTQPKPVGSYGPDHRNVTLTPSSGYIILDVVEGQIMCVEVLYRDEIRQALIAAIP